MRIENIKIISNKGKTLSGRIYHSAEESKTGVIFSHGLFSSKDGYKITQLAQSITDAGLRLLTFDFSFSGELGSNISELSISQEVEDLKAAIAYFKNSGIKKFYLMGSSMGGVVSILTSEYAGNSLISLICIATPIILTDILKNIKIDIDDIDSLNNNDLTEIDGIPIKNSFFKELKNINILRAIKNITVPALIIHGAKDNTVDIKNADLLKKSLKTECKSIIIEDGDHNLTGDKDLKIIRESILLWFQENK